MFLRKAEGPFSPTGGPDNQEPINHQTDKSAVHLFNFQIPKNSLNDRIPYNCSK